MKEAKNICYYYGDFVPPTKYHFDTAKMLETRSGISGVIIVVGNDKSDIITQDDKYELWNMMVKSEQIFNMKLLKTENVGSLKYIIDELEKSPNSKFFIAVDNKTAKSDKFNMLFSKYKGVEYQLIPSKFNDKSEELLDSLEKDDNNENLLDLLPITFNKKDIKKIKNMIFSNEDVEEKSEDLKETFLKSFDKIVYNIIK